MKKEDLEADIQEQFKALGFDEATIEKLRGLDPDQLANLAGLAVKLLAIRTAAEISPLDFPIKAPRAIANPMVPVPYEGTIPDEGFAREDLSKLWVLKSPMAGVVYWTSAPEKPPFIEEGDKIEPGATYGLIEAMKVFIEQTLMGTSKMRVVKILVPNGELVQAGQDLILVVPLD